MPDRPRSVLVADDDADIRRILRSALERKGYEVLEACSAAEVFRRLDEQQPDVILLDVHLGPEDGIALGIGLRKQRQFSKLKVVFIAGAADQPDLVELSNVWNVPILTKPFDLVELTNAVGENQGR